MIKVRAIGAAEVQIGRRRITASTEVVLALAVYLCVRAGERVSRDEVVAVFWPDAEEAKGRHSLRQMLYRLRQKGFVLDEEGEELWLDPGRVDSDVASILKREWQDVSTESDYPQVHGFLPGTRRHVAAPFREWEEFTRQRIMAHLRHAALRHLARARREGRWSDLGLWAERILATDPLNEEATLAKAESVAMSGAKATAIEILDDYVAELGDSAPRLQLPASVLRRRISERNDSWDAKQLRDIPLIGREKEVAVLSDTLDATLQREVRAVALTGAAGLGKSRLLSEVSEIAALRGFRALSIRVEPDTEQRPFSGAAQLAGAIAELPGAAGASPGALGLVRRIAHPEPGATNPRPVSGTELGTGETAWAIAELLSAVSNERRLLLTIDDAHHLDPHSYSALCSAILRATGARAAVIFAGRRAPSKLGRSVCPTSIARLPLEPLPHASALALAQALTTLFALTHTKQHLESIVVEARGNPLFIRELTLFSARSGSAGRLPQTLVDILSARLGQLDHTSTHLVRAIALLGPLASLARLRALPTLRATPLSPAIEPLEADGIVALSNEGVLTLHDCWRSAIIDSLSPATRAALSIELAEFLAGECARDPHVDAHWTAADLYREAGCAKSAASLYIEAGDRLLSQSMGRQASEAYTRAAKVASDSTRADALVRLARASGLAGDYEIAVSVSRELLALSPTALAQSPSARVEGLATLTDALWRCGQPHTEEVEALADAVFHNGVSASARHYACLCGLRTIAVSASSPLASRFIDCVEQSTEADGATVYGELARLIHFSEAGNHERVLEVSRSLDILCGSAMPSYLRVQARRYQATALRLVGRAGDACAVAVEAAEIARLAGLLEDAAHAAILLAFIHLDQASLPDAARWIAGASELAGAPLSELQLRQLHHASCRLLLQSSCFEDAFAKCRTGIQTAISDRVPRRQAADCACIAHAAAACGDRDTAESMIAIASRTLRADLPAFQLDYPAEATIEALSLLGDHAGAAALARSYLERRSAAIRSPLAPAMRRLLQFDADLQIQTRRGALDGSSACGLRSDNSARLHGL